MQEIALMNPRKRRRGARRRTTRSRSRRVSRKRSRRVVHMVRRNPRRRSGGRNPFSVSGIKGIFSKQNLMSWVYMGGGFAVGVAAEKSFGDRIATMLPFGQNIPLVQTFVKQIPLIAGIALFGKGMPKQAQDGMNAYIGYRLVNSALQMANINLSGVGDVGYTPSFGLSGIFSPTSSATLTDVSGVSDSITYGESSF